MQYHKYSLSELEDMLPFEREIYMGLLEKHIKDENERVERENQKNKGQEALHGCTKETTKRFGMGKI